MNACFSASGPWESHLRKASNNEEPKKIGWIQCVGFRNINCGDNGYCSSVCCTYAIKQAVMTRSHMTDGDGEQTILYMDIHSHGKEYERYYEKASQTGVSFVRSRPHTLLKGPEGHGVTMLWVDEAGKNHEPIFDLVILSVGLTNPESTKNLTKACRIELDQYGFAKPAVFLHP